MPFDPEKSPSKKDDLQLTTISIRPVSDDVDKDDLPLHQTLSSTQHPTKIVRGNETEVDEAAKLTKERVVYSEEYNAKLVKKIDRRIVVFAGKPPSSIYELGMHGMRRGRSRC
jgi:hypothetical protein